MFGAGRRVKEKCLFNNGRKAKKQKCHKSTSVKAMSFSISFLKVCLLRAADCLTVFYLLFFPT